MLESLHILLLKHGDFVKSNMQDLLFPFKRTAFTFCAIKMSPEIWVFPSLVAFGNIFKALNMYKQ